MPTHSLQSKSITLSFIVGLLLLTMLAACAPESSPAVEATQPPTSEPAEPSQVSEPVNPTSNTLRVPAEWEPHAATWMQWPGRWETAMRPAFVEIIAVIVQYEPLHLLVNDQAQKDEAVAMLAAAGVAEDELTWHILPLDNAWLRDNGPIYVTDGQQMLVQDWRFDGWGGNFGADVTYEADDVVPQYIAPQLSWQLQDRSDYILEKGNLEFNGRETLVLNWDCQDDRNPGLSQAEHEAILREAFGVTQIIWSYGHFPDDGTTGHIDGVARFINADTMAIVDLGLGTEQQLAADLEAAGFNVVWFEGNPNWLVGNGFVLGMREGNDADDAYVAEQLQAFFPDRNVHLVNADSIIEGGGGIHCVTNDQPALESIFLN